MRHPKKFWPYPDNTFWDSAKASGWLLSHSWPSPGKEQEPTEYKMKQSLVAHRKVHELCLVCHSSAHFAYFTCPTTATYCKFQHLAPTPLRSCIRWWENTLSEIAACSIAISVAFQEWFPCHACPDEVYKLQRGICIGSCFLLFDLLCGLKPKAFPMHLRPQLAMGGSIRPIGQDAKRKRAANLRCVQKGLHTMRIQFTRKQ